MYIFDHLLFILLLLQTNIISGQITNKAAEPIANVSVCTTSWNCITTNSNGLYQIENLHNVIRFSKAGLKPITVPAFQSTLNVVMEEANAVDSEWIIPYCPLLSENKGRRIGARLKVLVPKGITVQENSDIDYTMAKIYDRSVSDSEAMTIGDGPNWSMSGLPYWINKDMVDTIDRTVVCRNQQQDESASSCVGVVDIRGHSKAGKYWRFIGDSFETIEYANVSKASAEGFDKIMETLCVGSSGFK